MREEEGASKGERDGVCVREREEEKRSETKKNERSHDLVLAALTTKRYAGLMLFRTCFPNQLLRFWLIAMVFL
jgi:hypothetical protein